jgi:hypothetical protein
MTLFEKEHDMTEKVHDAEVDLIQRPSNLSRRLMMAAGAAGGIAAMATAGARRKFRGSGPAARGCNQRNELCGAC